jgi:hypothetical protein
MENTRHVGIEIKLPTANTKTSYRLARVMDGPTSTSALLILPSKGNSNGCRLTTCINIHIIYSNLSIWETSEYYKLQPSPKQMCIKKLLWKAKKFKFMYLTTKYWLLSKDSQMHKFIWSEVYILLEEHFQLEQEMG